MAIENGKIQQFANEELGANLRIVDRDGQPWFVAKDVAAALGYARTADAVREHCKGVGEMATPSSGGKQMMKIIPESDVYRLILRSKLPQAEAFQDWVVCEVLPSIREHGAYMTDNVLDQILADPRHMAELLTALADEREHREEVQRKLHYLRPDVPYGTPSETTGQPRTQLVKPYWRTGWRKITTVTTETEWQKCLFD